MDFTGPPCGTHSPCLGLLECWVEPGASHARHSGRDSLWDKLWGDTREEDRRGPCPFGVPRISFIKSGPAIACPGRSLQAWVLEFTRGRLQTSWQTRKRRAQHLSSTVDLRLHVGYHTAVKRNGPSVPTTTDGPHGCVGCKQVDTAVPPTTSRTRQHLGSLMWTGWNRGCLGTADAPGPLASRSGP